MEEDERIAFKAGSLDIQLDVWCVRLIYAISQRSRVKQFICMVTFALGLAAFERIVHGHVHNEREVPSTVHKPSRDIVDPEPIGMD